VKPVYDVTARKRPVNLTLNEDLLAKVRGLSDNLSGVVESLLAEFLAKERARRVQESEAARAAAAAWNEFAERAGSFADEHSTL
jgi:antitoxin CcdA